MARTKIEYAIDIWDLRGLDPRPDVDTLHAHLNEFGQEGWELVSMTFNVELLRHGECHLMVFKRSAADPADD